MSWLGLEGHEEVRERFRRAIVSQRIASTFLFVGPEGVGKRQFALRLAQTLQCLVNPPAEMNPCGKCESCRLALTGAHPDILMVSRPEGKAFIPLELLIGSKVKTQTETTDAASGETQAIRISTPGLCPEMSKMPYYGKRKIAIIDDADYLNLQGANAMLKTLEEPPKNSILILLGTSLTKQLPTIRSRCQVIPFQPLSTSVVEQLLRQILATQRLEKATKKKPMLEESMIPQLAAFSEGSVQKALELGDPGLWEFREVFFQELACGRFDRATIGEKVEKLLETAGKKAASGKEAAARRICLKNLMEMTADFYRRLAWYLSGALPTDSDTDARWETLLKQAAEHWKLDAEAAALAAMRTSDRIELLQRNVHMQTLLEAWMEELLLWQEGDARLMTVGDWTLGVKEKLVLSK